MTSTMRSISSGSIDRYGGVRIRAVNNAAIVLGSSLQSSRSENPRFVFSDEASAWEFLDQFSKTIKAVPKWSSATNHTRAYSTGKTDKTTTFKVRLSGDGVGFAVAPADAVAMSETPRLVFVNRNEAQAACDKFAALVTQIWISEPTPAPEPPEPTPPPPPEPTPTPPPTPTPMPHSGLWVAGNKLMADDKEVHLRGVNRSGTEYACISNYAIFEGPTDAASIQALKSWNVNFVRMGLNEDCILAINGVQSQYSGSTYMSAIKKYVDSLHAAGIYTEVSLMWAAPGTQPAKGQALMPDADHSADALRVIANTFKDDPKTIIGLYGEPHGVDWQCWRDGGSACNLGYAVLGIQKALDAVRATGATNVVTVSGIDYANNLSQWLQYKPVDPLDQLVAEQHVYGKNVSYTPAQLEQYTGPVAAKVPVIFSEFGETYDDSSTGTTNTKNMLDWADSKGVHYAAWIWNVWNTPLSLISNYNGTPYGNYGKYIHDRYLIPNP